MSSGINTNEISEWQSVLVLIVFVLTNVVVLFPFHVPVPVPQTIWSSCLSGLATLRIIPPSRSSRLLSSKDGEKPSSNRGKRIKWFRFPMNFLTAPLIADLFLLATTAIGRKEVYDGTIGTDHIQPIYIMLFFISLAYIAISLDASGLIRWLSLKVLQKGGSKGHLLYFYLYCFFFSLASFIGNDPIILSGTPFLAYMTRVSANIRDPKAWIFTQFSVANVASAILVSSNPTNLVLSGAFNIKFIDYTANMIVPVIITALLYFPFLLYYMFRDDSLVPKKIEMHEPPSEQKAPVNPNIPYSKGIPPEDEDADTEEAKILSLEEVTNPFLEKRSAIFSAAVMAVTLVTILAVNASIPTEIPVFWITLPAAVVVFCWDVSWGWKRRHETRAIAQEGRRKIEERRQEDERQQREMDGEATNMQVPVEKTAQPTFIDEKSDSSDVQSQADASTKYTNMTTEHDSDPDVDKESRVTTSAKGPSPEETDGRPADHEIDEKMREVAQEDERRTDLYTSMANRWMWARESFPTTTSVLSNLPLPLVPFSLCMFVLVQALVTRGWVTVFAWGWNDWVEKTGTIGAIGGMGFLAVVLCNFAGTNIGTTILLCRVVQEWVQIHEHGKPISERTFWATVYSMALGLNYGAFSTAFSASLAGMLWRGILAKKKIQVGARQFAAVNFQLIAFTMIIGSAALIGEVYIYYKESPYTGT